MKSKLFKIFMASMLSVMIVSGGIPVSPIADMFADLTLTAEAAGGTITGSGTQQAPYIIEDADDWAAFAANVNEGGSYQSAYVKLSDGFDNSSSAVTAAVGTESNPFKGTFDGNGQTLTVNIDDANVQGTAPFREIADGATIMNLKVTGSVKGTTHVAGLVGFSRTSADVTAFNTIDNCEVDVDVRVTTISGNRHMGGVVGHSTSSNLNIKNTLLEGTMYNTANYAGGLLGWTDGSTVNIENCLSKVSYTGTITNGFHPVAIKNYGASVTVNTDRVYYTARPSLSSQNYIAANGVRLYSSPVFGVATTLITALDGQMYYATDADPDYSIDSAEEWDSFALSVNEGNNFQGVTVTLNTDITVSTMVGTANDKFKGTFNGNGHTLDLDLTSNGEYCAPFRYVDGAKFRFITTTGTVAAGSNKYGSGLIGNATGTPSVKGCRSNVTVTSQISGDGTHGGFVGVADSSIYFTDCLFDGTISGASTNCCGGFIDWISSGTVTYENCLMAGVMNISVDSSAVFNRFNSNAKAAFTNCYYKGFYDGMTLQGTATTASGSELKNLLGNAWKVDVDGSGVIPVTDATDIGTASVSYLKSEYDYTGDTIVINPVVTDANGTELEKTLHYTAALAYNGTATNRVCDWGTYTYTITAVEGSGYSGTKVCPFTVKAPDAPSGLKQVASGASSVTVTWDDVLGFNDWDVRLSDDPDFENVIDTVSVSGSRVAVFTGLEDETNYYAAVRWVKNGSAGDWSDALMCPTTTKRWIGLGEDTDKFSGLPVDCYYNYSLSEQIYTPEEIGGPGLIEALDFMILSTDNTRTFDIYMLHTSKTSFADNSDWVAVTEDDKVFSGTVTFAPDEWTTITLETPFVYNGTDNLLLVFDDNTGSYTDRTYFQVITGQSQSSIYLHSDNTNADPTNPTINASDTKEYKNAVRLKMGRTDNLVATVVTGINKTYYYTGSVIEDQPTIRNFDGEELEEGVHYTKMLTLNGVPVGEIKDIGEYVYTFTAVQGGGYTGSRTYEFSVVGPPDPENLYVASHGKNFAQITWTQTGDASSWMVQYSTNPEFTTGVRTVTVNGTPEVQLTGLTPDTYYYVRVRWVIADMKSDWTDKVGFETSTKRVIGGAEDTTPQYSFLPCYVYYCYSLTQQIFTSDELGNPAAFTSIDFKCGEDTTRTLEIYLAHTDKSEFEDDEDWIIVSEDDLVFSGDVAFAANEWTTIPFDNPFAYNGTDNVVLVVADNTGTYEDEGLPFAAQDSGKSMALYDYRDNSSFHPTQTNTHSNNYVTTWRNVARINALETNDIQSATVKGEEKVYGYTKSVISVTPELYDVLGNQLEEDVDYTAALTYEGVPADEVKEITFINGETASTQNIWEYEYAERPADPEKDGYRFGCWVDEDGIEFDFSSRVTRDITLTAKWNEVKPLAVGTIFYIGDWIGFDEDYYYSNDKEDNPSVLFSSEAVQVKEITMLGNSYLVNMNYKSNQCLLVVHTENHYENPAVKAISGDGTSSASAYKFEIVGAELDTVHTVRWVDSDGTTTLRTDENVPWGTRAVYGGDIDVPDGYFLYWNDGNKTYADANMPNVTKNVCFTAVFSTVEPIHVGSVFKAGDDVGFAYYYFNRDDEAGNVTAFNGYGIMTIKSITYNSSYSQYYVTPVDALTIYVSSPTDLGPNVHIKVIAGSGTSEDPFVLKAFVPDQAEPYFKVGFVSNGALVFDESVESGAVLTESNYKLTHDELIHIGWLDENGDMFDFSTPITSDMTLTAYWLDPNVTCTVTFMAEDRQEVIDQVDVPEGYVLGEIMNLMALHENDESMMFVGWFNENGTKFDFNEMITHDVTVYEKWELPSEQTDHVVTFKQFDNIIFRITVEDGSVIPAMYAGFDLQITGMKQYGWKLGSSAFDFTTPITEDITLTANLIEDNTFDGHYVTFIDGDRVYGKIGVAHGATPDESPYLVYAPENYDLDNWYYGDVPFDQVVVTEDIEVSARWVNYYLESHAYTTDPKTFRSPIQFYGFKNACQG